ncbi:MAG: hypothetical protein ABIG63_10115 [Chloroflexota bacterium]
MNIAVISPLDHQEFEQLQKNAAPVFMGAAFFCMAYSNHFCHCSSYPGLAPRPPIMGEKVAVFRVLVVDSLHNTEGYAVQKQGN